MKITKNKLREIIREEINRVNSLNESRGNISSFKDVKYAVETLFSDKRVGVGSQANKLYTTSNPSQDKYAIVHLDNEKSLTFIYDNVEKSGIFYIEGRSTNGHLFENFDELISQLKNSKKHYSKWFEQSGIQNYI